MTCRLFIDEVGNDDVNHPKERYLSLTGIITKRSGCERKITPEIEAAKADFFGHNPPHKIVVLHRRELVRHEPPFEALRDPVRNAEWEKRVLEIVDRLPYLAITVMIDKHEHKERYKTWLFNSYHYCLTALVERYVLWLQSKGHTGDVIAEPRYKRGDKALKRAFQYIWKNGSGNISGADIQKYLTSRELKFEPKTSNNSGLQLVELIAHASHHGTKAKFTNVEMQATFGAKVYAILEAKKYRRNPKTMKIEGWGQKWLP
jgi:hypothetical protein